MPDVEKVQGDPEPEPTDKAEGKTEPAKGTEKEQSPEEIRAELARLREHNHKLNEESAGRRKRIAELEKAEKDRLDAQKTEQQKKDEELEDLRKKNGQYESELRSVKVNHAVELQALAMGFHDSDDALRPEVLSAVEFDDDGKIVQKSIRDSLKKLLEAKPYLRDASEDEPEPPKTKKPTNGTPAVGSATTPKPGTTPEPARVPLCR